MNLRQAIGLSFLIIASQAFADEPSMRARNEQAVAEVAVKTRTTASAAWWGFNPEDSTEILQAAIDSGAKTVVVPYMGQPWIVRPIRLHSDLDVLFEPGVVVWAKKGEFLGKGDSLFTASDIHDLTMRGYGATLRMNKTDYQNPPYDKAEWRMGIDLGGCERVTIEGLRIESSGGDGVYVGAGKLGYCKDVTIRNVVCFDNHRQGISVITAENLLIENCTMSNTSGTAPAAGIDLEPNKADERLVNCTIRNCLFEGNKGGGIVLYLKPLAATAQPLSVRFEDCLVRSGAASGIVVASIKDDGPTGTVEFVRCVTENTANASVRLSQIADGRALVRFTQCAFTNPWRVASEDPKKIPAAIRCELNSNAPDVAVFGGVEFRDCTVFDDAPRPTVAFVSEDPARVRNVSGLITRHGPMDEKSLAGLGGETTLKVDAAK